MMASEPPLSVEKSVHGQSDLAVESALEIGPVCSGNAAEDAAAITVQKLYRSYRTRRNLADCAVMAKKYGWWNVLEGALLRQDSITFYAFEKHDTAATRWSRLRKKAAKVGKGLSKDEKARKLAIQHWLEAIDARHRYGHNLHFYYDAWMESSTTEPFFYWLDVGEGRDLDLPACKRSRLQKEQIKYLGPREREQYEVVVADGKLLYKKSGEFVNTPKGDKWIFVMSTSGKLYVAQKDKGKFQHSSFLAGGATTAAGRLLVRDGTLELMEAHSGHYRPTEENFNQLVSILTKLGTDLGMAKVQCVSDDMLYSGEKLSKIPSEKRETDAVRDNTDNCEATSSNAHGLSTESQEKVETNLDAEVADLGFEDIQNIKSNGGNHTDKNLKVVKGGSSDWDGLQIELLARRKSASDIKEKELLPKTAGEELLPMSLPLSAIDLNEDTKACSVQQPPSKELYSSPMWSSGAGPRISSLSDIPREVREKALHGIEKPIKSVSTGSACEVL